MGNHSKIRTANDLLKTPEFQTFVETSDLLKFSLECHQAYSDHQISFEEGLDLAAHFPKASGQCVLVEKGMLLVLPADHQIESENIGLISAGIHGNETAPIEIVRDQLKDILQGKQKIGLPLLFIFGHLEAMIQAHRQVEENLNRLFFTSRSHLKLKPRSQEAIRALEIQYQVARFVQLYGKDKTLVHYDLHTAIRKSEIEKFCVHPFIEKRKFRDEQFHFLSSMGVEAVLFSHAHATTFSCYTANEFAAESFTVELGAVAKFGKNDLSRFHATNLALRSFYQTAGFTELQTSKKPRSFDVVRTLVRRHEKFHLPFSEDLPNFSTFQKDQVMMEDGPEMHLAQADGERIVFPNSKVGIGERVALVVKERKA